MSYGTDNDLSRPNFDPSRGAPVADGRVLGTYEHGRGPVTQPAQPTYAAPTIAPAAQPPAPQFHNYQQPQGYQPQYQHGQPAQQPTHQVPATPLTPTLNQPADHGTPPTPVFNPSTGQWELPSQTTQVYQNGIPQGNFANNPAPIPQPVQQPAVPVQAPVGNSYIETSINHLTSTLGVSADTFDNVIAAAVQYGDANLINPAALGVQLTPEQTAQVKQLAQGAVQYIQAENARVDNIAYAAAGGKAQWEQASGTFNAVANPDTRSYVQYLVDSGNHEQAAQVVLNTVRGYGYQPQGQAPVAPSAIAGQQGLSGAAFKDAIGKLKQEAGNASLETGIYREKYDALVQQRMLGRQQGLA